MSNQFQVICKQCGKTYIVQTEPGMTVKCQCTFCQSMATVAAPLADGGDNQLLQVQKHPQKESNIGRKVVITFIIVFLIVIIVFSVLYAVFSAMSN